MKTEFIGTLGVLINEQLLVVHFNYAGMCFIFDQIMPPCGTLHLRTKLKTHLAATHNF